MLRNAFIIVVLVLSAAVLKGQDALVTATFEEQALSTILKELQVQSGQQLAFDTRSMGELSRSLVFVNTPIGEALTQALQGSGYEPVRIKDTWLVIPIDIVLPREIEEEEIRRKFKVSGRLVDARSGEPLSYATIAISGSGMGTVSNLDGYFSMTQVPVDTLQVCFSYVGYRGRCLPMRQKITENMTIRLERAETYLLAVDIIAQQSEDISLAPREGMIKLDPGLLSRVAATGHSDIFNTVKLLPGVSGGDELDAQLHIRGSAVDENLVLFDGFTLYHLDHFFGAFSTINEHAVQDVSLYNGPYSSKYGGRSGGVLDIVGRTGDRYGSHTRVDMDAIQTGIMTEGPVGDHHSYLVSFRRSHTDYLRTGYYDELLSRVFAQSVIDESPDLIGESVESDYFFHDFNMKWTTRIADKDRISFSVYNGGDRIRSEAIKDYDPVGPLELRDLQEDESAWGTVGLGLVWTRNPRAGKEIYTSLGRSRYQSNYFFSDTQQDINNGIQLPSRTSSDLNENSVRDITFVHRRTQDLAYGGKASYGYEYTRLNVGEREQVQVLASNSARLVDSTNVSIQHSLFYDHWYDWENGVSLSVGGRIMKNSFTNSLYVQPRVKLTYDVTPELEFFAASGNYTQVIRRVAQQNLFLRQPDLWQLSDGERLPEARSWHSAIGLQWSRPGLTIGIEGYYKRIKGVIINQEQNRILNAFTQESQGISAGEGRVAGVDLLMTYDRGAHSAWLAYSYTYSANRFDDIDSLRVFPSIHNRPHDLKLTYSYRQKHFTFHSRFNAGSGYPFTPILGTFNGANGDEFLIYGDDLSLRLPYYMRWDASVSRIFHHRDKSITLALGLMNILDRENIKRRTYGLSQRRGERPDGLRFSTIDLELLPRSPTFSIRVDFR